MLALGLAALFSAFSVHSHIPSAGRASTGHRQSGLAPPGLEKTGRPVREMIIKFAHPRPARLSGTARGLFSALEPLFRVRPGSEKEFRELGLDRIFKVKIPVGSDPERFKRDLMRTGLLQYAEANTLLPVEAVPNDSLYPQLWHLARIHAPEAWEEARGDSSVVIAIIDTGVDWTHPDLSASIWRNSREVENGVDDDGNGFIDDVRGWDFVESVSDHAPGEDGGQQDNDPMDFDGHGTFVAGIAASTTDNGIGVASVPWGCRIMPLRAGYRGSDFQGYIVLDAAIRAFVYAADNGADIINFSTTSSEALVDAARYAFLRDVVIVKSAGNSNSDTPDPLEQRPFVVTVAATDSTDRKASYSDFGAWVTLSAPGGDRTGGGAIISTAPGGSYGAESGTSYAAAVVSGLAGLVKSFRPGSSASDVIFQLAETCESIDLQNTQYHNQLGRGRIHAFRALSEWVQPRPDLSLLSLRIDDRERGNGNGLIEPAEGISLCVRLCNRWGDAMNLRARLIIDHPAVTLEKSDAHYSFIPGISKWGDNCAGNEDDPFRLKVDGHAVPCRVDALLQVEGLDGYSWRDTLSFAVSPSLLLVDDDDGINNVQSYYCSALDSANMSYTIWDHEKLGTPEEVLEPFDTVIWFCEQTGTATATLDSDDRRVLRCYLDRGGSLFISGQDIGWDLCDPGADAGENEFQRSEGASRSFYRDYLGADYLQDISFHSRVVGVDGDPVSDGFEFDFSQPGRPQQYPSEVAPLDGAVTLFSYPNRRAAAVRSDGSFRMVYFAFGGLEAVVPEQDRLDLLPRITDWLNGIRIEHSPLQDTRNTGRPHSVRVTVDCDRSPLSSMSLYWSRSRSAPFHRVEMKRENDSTYCAGIPTQPPGELFYFYLAQLENGYSAPFQVHRFKIEPDDGPPVNVAPDKGRDPLPGGFYLSQSFPNPFNSGTAILFELDRPADVRLEVHNRLGRRVRTLAGGVYPAGRHRIRWNGRDQGGEKVSAGLYFLRLQTGTKGVVRKALLLN